MNIQIIVPLLKTTSDLADSYELWKSTALIKLSVGDIPKEVSQIISGLFKFDKEIVAFKIDLADTSEETVGVAIENWEKHLSYLRIIYWVECGIIINPYMGFVISNNDLIRTFKTPRGIALDGWQPKKFQSYGISVQFLDEFRKVLDRLHNHDALNKLSAFFNLVDAAFDSHEINVRLTLFVSSLESLLLPGTNHLINQKMKIRAPFLATNTEEERNALENEFKTIYDLRSRYIHGDSGNIELNLFEAKNPVRRKTSYGLEQRFLRPIFRKVLHSDELIRKRCLKVSKRQGYKQWNNMFPAIEGDRNSSFCFQICFEPKWPFIQLKNKN